YLKAQRDGLSSLESPSIQNFKNELKTLTTMLGNFDDEEGITTTKSSPQNGQNQSQSQSQSQNQQVQTQSQPSQQPQTQQTHSEQSQQSQQTQTSESSMNERHIHESLDQKSIHMVQEIKNSFNLSSDTEALRMLIKIGYIKAIGFYKSL
nr:hypothetical protein [Pseudobdellovibrionaceae bacterium]